VALVAGFHCDLPRNILIHLKTVENDMIYDDFTPQKLFDKRKQNESWWNMRRIAAYSTLLNLSDGGICYW